ncbi:hypothetical protein ASD88_13255 [Pelomonas sp. Root662]|nr:hypothetical protein ASC81_13255 [Pelomonas sp. Root405]KRA72689.1 hypothetical protein ASD88_13255 [Pelomonas sp. Root662]
MASEQQRERQWATDHLLVPDFAHMHLVFNHLNVANQIDERLNTMRKAWRLNTTQMLVIADLVATARRPIRLESQVPASASELAARLQQSRPMISIQLKGLSEDGYVEKVEVGPSSDRRAVRYRLTARGFDQALKVTKVVGQLSVLLRNALGHALSSRYESAVGRLVKKLPEAPALEGPHAAQEFRYETIRKRRRATLAAKGAKRR